MPNANSHDLKNAKLDGQLLDSRAAVELLPWLVNGSLDGAEIEAVGSRLQGLEGTEIADELAATGEMLWITDQHLPTMTLVEYALGLPSGEMGDIELSREEIEHHLEGCAACRAELALIQADESADQAEETVAAPVLDFASARRRTLAEPAKRPAAPHPSWRRLALAAVLATAVAGALLVQVRSDLETPTGPDVAGLEVAGPTAEIRSATDEVGTDTILRTSIPETALFSDDFESGDTGRWTIVSN